MRFSNGFCALASALLLAACGGNDVAVSINGPGFTVNTYHNGQQRNHNDNGGNIGGGAFVPPGNIGGAWCAVAPPERLSRDDGARRWRRRDALFPGKQRLPQLHRYG